MLRKTINFLVILVLVVLAVFTTMKYSNAIKIDRKGYQGVVLTTGIAYYGHVKNVNDDYVTLQDVYYLEQQSGMTPPLRLIKFGTEPQGPKDSMYMNRDQILYLYNLDETKELYNRILETKKTQGGAK